MYGKIAVRNVKRSAKDYLVYFVTIMLTAALMFAFNTLLFSKDILSVSDSIREFRAGIVFVSVVVVLIVALLISYTTSFILKKRKKEFATYLLLGMSRNAVSWMFLLENVLIGLVSLAVGVGVGALLYQVFAAIIMGMFQAPYKVSLSFTWQAVVLTLGYFVVIYFCALLRSRRYLKKTRIYDMMQAARRNEKAVLRSPAAKMTILIGAVLLIAASMLTIWLFLRATTNGASLPILLLFAVFAVLIFAVVAFYIGVSSLLSLLMTRNRRYFYKGTNLFLAKQVTAKVNTNGLLMGVIAVMLSCMFVAMSVCMTIRDDNMDMVERWVPFDIQVDSPNDLYTDTVSALIEERVGIESACDYRVYDTGRSDVKTALGGEFYGTDKAMSLSSYNELRRMLGLAETPAPAGGYLLHANDTALGKTAKKLAGKGLPLTIAGKTLPLAAVYDEPFGTNAFHESLVVVVADELLAEAEVSRYMLAVQAARDVPESFQEELDRYLIELAGAEGGVPGMWDGPSCITRTYIVNNNQGANAMILFGAFYIGIVFTFMSAAILAIQQLSDSAEHRERFRVLRKLGVEEREIGRLIFKQLAIYFALPLLLPVLLGLFGSVIMAGVLAGATIASQFYVNFGITLGVFFALYLCYFTVTYFGFRRNVSESARA